MCDTLGILTYSPAPHRARQLPQLPQLQQPQAAGRGAAAAAGRGRGLSRLLADLGAEGAEGRGAQGRPLLALDGFRTGLASLPLDVWTGAEGSTVGELVRDDAFTLALFRRCDADEDGLLSHADLQASTQQ